MGSGRDHGSGPADSPGVGGNRRVKRHEALLKPKPRSGFVIQGLGPRSRFPVGHTPSQMKATLTALGDALVERSDQLASQRLFERAMVHLLSVEVSLAAGRWVPSEGLAAFKQEAVHRICKQESVFRDFCNMVDRAAKKPRQDWYEASFGRSVLQIFTDNYQETGIDELIDLEQIAEIDADLRNGADIAPPLSQRFIPQGLPPTHWWWTAPSGPPWGIADI